MPVDLKHALLRLLSLLEYSWGNFFSFVSARSAGAVSIRSLRQLLEIHAFRRRAEIIRKHALNGVRAIGSEPGETPLAVVAAIVKRIRRGRDGDAFDLQ